MSDFQTIRTVPLEDRRAYVPSDVMSLAQYKTWKVKFNEDLPRENAKIQARNAKLHESQKPEIEAELFPMETVTMMAPKQFIIIRQDYKRILFPAGIFECPIELADDWYLLANNATKYANAVTNPIAKPKDLTEAETAIEDVPVKNPVAAKRVRM